MRAPAVKLRLPSWTHRTEEDAPERPEASTPTQERPEASRRDARRAQRDAKRAGKETHRARLRRLAARTADAATGQHYARTGFMSTGQRIAAYTSLTGVLVCVGYMSWDGEYNWATYELLWLGLSALMVPVALDLAAVACTLLAATQIDKGESGFLFRVLGAVFMALGAWINWRYALRSGNVTEEVFFPAMSTLAYSLIHAVLSAARREARRRQHGHKSRERVKPLPRFGALVWVPFLGMPVQALGALKDAIELRMRQSLVAAGLTDADDETQDAPEREEEEQETPDDEDTDAPSVPSIEGLTQAAAIRVVIDALGPNSLPVVTHLRTHGWPGIRTSSVTDVIRRDAKRAARTQADAGASGADAGAPDQDSADAAASAG
jgi:hypothetical protein